MRRPFGDGGARGRKPNRDTLRAIGAIAEQLLTVWGDTADCYARIKPDGRALDDDELAAARERVEAISEVLRGITGKEALLRIGAEQSERLGRDRDLRPTIVFVRILQRNLILAMSVEQAALRVRPLVKFWQVY
jgi:hypothetical protein